MINERLFYIQEEKREVPFTLRQLLAVDAYLTNAFVNWAEQVLFLRQLKTYHKVLDVRLIIYFVD